MKAIDRSLPYPVLSPLRDDVLPNRFELNCSCRADAMGYYISYEFVHDNATLKEMIGDGRARYAVHVECRDCFYRVLEPNHEAKGTVDILGDDVVGVIEVTGFIIAAHNIPTYRLPEAHNDYGNATFQVRIGDILASSRAFTFEAEKEFDPLKKVSSIMQLLPSAELDGPFAVDFSQGKITVYLSKTDYNHYGQARNDPRIASSLIQGIVFPVLVTALGDAHNSVRDNEPLQRWAEIVRQRLRDLGSDLPDLPEEAIKLAQIILQNPTNRFLQDLMRITEGDHHEP